MYSAAVIDQTFGVTRPRWVRPLLAVGAILFVGRLTGAIEIPDGVFWLALTLESSMIAFELFVIVSVMRHFYREHRADGHDKFEAYIRAEIDEMKASGIPDSTAETLGRAMRWELNIYRSVVRYVRRMLGREA